MPTKQHEQNFAQNDKAVAQIVNAAGSHHSWTIIISFYSALHFVRSKIFPLAETIEGKSVTLQSFDSYCMFHPPINSSKHHQLIALIARHIPSIQVQYKWLYDNSITARYHNYFFDPSYATKALTYLDAIEQACK